MVTLEIPRHPGKSLPTILQLGWTRLDDKHLLLENGETRKSSKKIGGQGLSGIIISLYLASNKTNMMLSDARQLRDKESLSSIQTEG